MFQGSFHFQSAETTRGAQETSNNSGRLASKSSVLTTMYRLDAHLRTAMELNNTASSLLDSGNCGGPGPVVETLTDAVALLTTPHAVEFRVGGSGNVEDERALREYIKNNNDAIMRAEVRLLENDVMLKRAERNFAFAAATVSADDEKNEDAPPPSFVDGGGALLVYARPFVLAALPQGTEINVEEVSAAVLFNMALTYHLEAAALLSRHQAGHPLPSAGRTRYLLDKALSFYELCSTMISQIHLSGIHDGSALGPDGLLRLLEALLNNMGQISVEHGDRRRGEERFQDLHRVYARGHGDVDGREGIHPFDFNMMVVGQMTAAATA